MIERKNILEVADLENRPRRGKVYPAGTIIIQIAATQGQVLYLREEKEIEEKYAVIQPKINSFYLFLAIKKFFPPFFERRKQGLNFKAEELKALNLDIHQDEIKQNLIASMMKKIWGGGDFY